MKVSVVIATRGDVDLSAILESHPPEWEVLVYDNGAGEIRRRSRIDRSAQLVIAAGLPDLGPHARFALIEYASHELMLAQDDDCVVSDPQELVRSYGLLNGPGTTRRPDSFVVCNMPQEFRPHYSDSAMVGFGAVFHRDAPERAFKRFFAFHGHEWEHDPLFLRESCRIFTTLTPRVLVDVPKRDLPWASDPNRLWKQKEHFGKGQEMLRLAREVRDA